MLVKQHAIRLLVSVVCHVELGVMLGVVAGVAVLFFRLITRSF